MKAFLPDIDGVLVMSEPLHAEKNVAIAAEHGIEITPETWDNELHGIGDHRIYTWLSERGLSLSEEQYLSACEGYYSDNKHRLEPRRGARQMLEFFQKLDIPVIPVSSGVKSQVEANLSLFPDIDFIDTVTADDVTKTKPDPEPYLQGMEKACNALGWTLGKDVKPADFITVEDSVTGVESAKAAGIIGIHWLLAAGAKQSPVADSVVYHAPDLITALCKNRLTNARSLKQAERASNTCTEVVQNYINQQFTRRPAGFKP